MWVCNDLEDVVDQLNEKIPFQGECELKHTKNKHLDRYRRCQNIVHDIFNNGLMNRGRELKLLGVSAYEIGYPFDTQGHFEIAERVVEPIVRKFIELAAEEQGVALNG